MTHELPLNQVDLASLAFRVVANTLMFTVPLIRAKESDDEEVQGEEDEGGEEREGDEQGSEQEGGEEEDEEENEEEEEIGVDEGEDAVRETIESWASDTCIEGSVLLMP